jgi:hypothetical protein
MFLHMYMFTYFVPTFFPFVKVAVFNFANFNAPILILNKYFHQRLFSKTTILAVAEDGALRGWTLNSWKENETNVWKSVFEYNNSDQIINMYSDFSSKQGGVI